MCRKDLCMCALLQTLRHSQRYDEYTPASEDCCFVLAVLPPLRDSWVHLFVKLFVISFGCALARNFKDNVQVSQKMQLSSHPCCFQVQVGASRLSKIFHNMQINCKLDVVISICCH